MQVLVWKQRPRTPSTTTAPKKQCGKMFLIVVLFGLYFFLTVSVSVKTKSKLYCDFQQPKLVALFYELDLGNE